MKFCYQWIEVNWNWKLPINYYILYGVNISCFLFILEYISCKWMQWNRQPNLLTTTSVTLHLLDHKSIVLRWECSSVGSASSPSIIIHHHQSSFWCSVSTLRDVRHSHQRDDRQLNEFTVIFLGGDFTGTWLELKR